MTGGGFFDSISRLTGATSARSSSWDRTGGNLDNIRIFPGETATLVDIEGAGKITHIWMTVASPDIYWGRRLVIRGFFDGGETPCFEVPLGDFFGMGNCRTYEWWSLPFSCGPVGGRGMNCWLPMPFDSGARLEVSNDGPLPALAVYYYIDYEMYLSAEREAERDAADGRFHAHWRREKPEAVDHSDQPSVLGFRGVNLSGENNYRLFSAKGRGKYVGCHLFVHNAEGGWWGEGDDMFFVDGEGFPPSLHGTGTEDYFGTAWSPSETFHSPFHGISFAERSDWKGFSAWYRFHLADPVYFQREISVGIEHGHANDRSDDWSSVAYWYQGEPHLAQPELPGPSERLPPVSSEREGQLMQKAEETMATLMREVETSGEGTDAQITVFARMMLLGQEIERLLARGDLDRLESLLGSVVI